MHVLYVANLYHPHVGGVESMISDLSRNLGPSGRASVLTKRWPASLPRKSRYGRVNVYRVHGSYDRPGLLELASQVRELARTIRPDVVHVIGIRRPLPLFALLLARLHDVPVVMSAAGTEIPTPHNPDSIRVWKEGRTTVPESLRQADVVTAVSDYTKDELCRAMSAPIRIQKMLVGAHYQKIRRVRKADNQPTPYVLSLRRLDPMKGIESLIDAFSEIAEDFPDLRLLIAGVGPERDRLEAQAGRSTASERIHFLGRTSWERGISLLKGAAATIVASRHEGGGLVNVEANMAGCPLIASRQGGIKEYARSACFVSPGSSDEIATALRKVLTDERYAERLKRDGQLGSRTLSWQVLRKQYYALYRDAIRTYQARPFRPWDSLSREVAEVFNGS